MILVILYSFTDEQFSQSRRNKLSQ